MNKRDWIFLLVFLLGMAVIMLASDNEGGNSCIGIFCTHEQIEEVTNEK